jgi:hypothetical protein
MTPAMRITAALILVITGLLLLFFEGIVVLAPWLPAL